jgi:hypothetical protein
MDSDSVNDDERANRLSFYYFIGSLGLALLAGLWMLVQMAFL